MVESNSAGYYRNTLSGCGDDSKRMAVVHRDRKENEDLSYCSTDGQSVNLVKYFGVLDVLEVGLITIYLVGISVEECVPDQTNK